VRIRKPTNSLPLPGGREFLDENQVRIFLIAGFGLCIYYNSDLKHQIPYGKK